MKSGELLKLRSVIAELTVEIVGKNVEIAVVIDEAAVYTAIVFVADAIERRGIGYRQRLQQDGVYQREDGGVGANAKSKGENHGDGKSGRFA